MNELQIIQNIFRNKKIKYVTNQKEFCEAVKLNDVDVICFIEEKKCG